MNKTVLITGTSSGFGAAAVMYFAEKGWNVIATMRDLGKAKVFKASDKVFPAILDVQDSRTIDAAIGAGLKRFGTIDAVVNNAGYGLFGSFESVSPEAVLNQFAVNVFGVMNVTRAILPYFREQGKGTIVNVSSGAGAIGFPMASVYSASKFALEGFSESLRYELSSLGIHIKIIEPGGALQTGFGARVDAESTELLPVADYLPFLQQMGALYGGMQAAADPEAVVKVVAAIYEAATDGSNRLRYTPTTDILPLLSVRRGTSEATYQEFTDRMFGIL